MPRPFRTRSPLSRPFAVRSLPAGRIGVPASLVAAIVLVLGLFCTAGVAEAAPVEFRYVPPADAQPSTVSVRGSFNDWGEAPMVRQADGSWTVTLDLSGEITYKYFIDGQWPSDMSTGRDGGPLDAAAESYVDDGFGGKNAVRTISGVAAPVPPLFDPAPAPALNADTARIHYHRPDGDYRGWGLHTWLDAAAPTEWTAPLAPGGQTEWGLYWDVPLRPSAARLGFLIHAGDRKDPGPDQFVDIESGRAECWIVSARNEVFPSAPEVAGFALGDPTRLAAHWVDRRTLLWNAGPGTSAVRLHGSADATLEVTAAGVGVGASSGSAGAGGGHVTFALAPLPGGAPASVRAKFPHLAALPAWQLSETDTARAGEVLRGQILLAAEDGAGHTLRVSGIQIPGVLDDLFTYHGPLGTEWHGEVPTLHVWAPTAREVRLLLFPDPVTDVPLETIPMGRSASGVWSATGAASWDRLYYLYEVEVFVPSTGRIEINRVTDPYSRSLAGNGARSQIVDLSDSDLLPDGWGRDPKPPLAAPEDIVLYELHVRDFSALDAATPAALRGTFRAFTLDTPPTRHLRRLAAAGLTHVHLLPSFDLATIDEDRASWPGPRLPDDTGGGAGSPDANRGEDARGAGTDVSFAALEALPPDSDEQQARLVPLRRADGYNWGYDPHHFGVPEGSYATEADGPARIREFREMVQALQGMGLRVVMDVVYNHTHESGQGARSVFDRIVPGYYHRLDENGNVATSTCCANTASEHAMMERFIGDDLVHWARDYHVDGFRFDLMGHHMKANLLAWQDRLHALTPAIDGVDGASIYLYGEGWDFGEVQGGKRGTNATQRTLAGTGIGTFNDRIRDSLRGGNPFGDRREQGFATGLFLEPAFQGATGAEQQRLLDLQDRIRVGMAGNLADYRFVARDGRETSGSALGGTGYAQDPQEAIQYASAHDNETLFDKILYATPAGLGLADRARLQTVALSVVALSQGIPFFHAGSEILRSKCFDADSYDSGDWFNRLDFTYQSNNFGRGLPPAEKNESRWPILAPLLARRDLTPSSDEITAALERFESYLRVRRSSPLFRLRDADEIRARVRFHDPGEGQREGFLVMSLADEGATGADAASEGARGVGARDEVARGQGAPREDAALASIDPRYARILVLVNAAPEARSFTHPGLVGKEFRLHPDLQAGTDAVVKESRFDPAAGRCTVPARTTAVFVVED